MAMWGRLGANGTNDLSSLLVHGIKRLRAGKVDLRGDRQAFAGREAPSDGTGALAALRFEGAVCHSGSTATLVDSIDRGGDATFGCRTGRSTGAGSVGAEIVQAPVFFEGAALSDGQARAACPARGALLGLVLEGRGRARWRRGADRSVGAGRMGERLCRREGGLLGHRRQAGSVGLHDGGGQQQSISPERACLASSVPIAGRRS